MKNECGLFSFVISSPLKAALPLLYPSTSVRVLDTPSTQHASSRAVKKIDKDRFLSISSILSIIDKNFNLSIIDKNFNLSIVIDFLKIHHKTVLEAPFIIF